MVLEDGKLSQKQISAADTVIIANIDNVGGKLFISILVIQFLTVVNYMIQI
jgi:hypothetical protein